MVATRTDLGASNPRIECVVSPLDFRIFTHNATPKLKILDGVRRITRKIMIEPSHRSVKQIHICRLLKDTHLTFVLNSVTYTPNLAR